MLAMSWHTKLACRWHLGMCNTNSAWQLLCDVTGGLTTMRGHSLVGCAPGCVQSSATRWGREGMDASMP